jgi:mitochondrial fission protein ELM1
MSKLKGLLLTQGMHGMISQVEGLAKALHIDVTHHKGELKNFWKFVPPKLTPISQNIYKKINDNDFDLIISCGRKSVIPSLALKKKYKEKIFTIHIQDPKVSLKKFDLIICPEHDNITGNNVIKTTGAIHYLSEKEISKENNYLKIDKENKKIIAFIIGGPNKYYTYSDKEIDFLFNKIKSIFTRDKYKLVVIPSYRTPPDIIKKAFNSFGHDHMVIKDVDKKAYLSALSISDYIVVTCDSTSMISEAAITGKPIYVAQMNTSKNNLRFQKFFSQFKQLNIIKDLTDKIDLWSYSKLDEVNRISPLINEKIKKNGII